MDTSSGLSSIASLSLGFTMSMRAGSMAFAANRAAGGPLTAAFPTSAWTVRPPSSPSAIQPSTPGSTGTSPRPLRGDHEVEENAASSRSTAVESCRSLVVPCVSLVSAPLASNDRPLDMVDLQRQATDPAPHHSVSPIVELAEDSSSSSSSSSSDGEQQLTITIDSENAECSPPVITLSSNAVEFQTLADAPMPHMPLPPSPPTTDHVASTNETVIEIDETPLSVTAAECGRTSVPATEDVVVNRLETRRTLVDDSDSSLSDQYPEDEQSVSPAALPSETNSSDQVLDDVIIVMKNDVNGDVVGTFFTPSIADSFAEAVSPRSECEPIVGLVHTTDSPAGPVPDVSGLVTDGGSSCRRSDSFSTAAPLLNNGADSSTVGWTPTTRFGLAAENSASAGAASVWRKNPLTRLVRHRKDTVRDYIGCNFRKDYL